MPKLFSNARSLPPASTTISTLLSVWGNKRHPFIPRFSLRKAPDPATAARREEWTAWLWMCDEPGELHEKSGDELVANGTAEAVAWIVDASIAGPVAEPLLQDRDWRPRLVQSRRERRFDESPGDSSMDGEAPGAVAGTADSELARHRADAARLMEINQSVLHNTRMLLRPAVAVVLTKLDLVAVVLDLMEPAPQRPGHPTTADSPLWDLLGARRSEAVHTAASGLIWAASYWLDPSRQLLISPAAKRFLSGIHESPRRHELAERVTVNLINHFGTADAFWRLVNTSDKISVPASVFGRAGDGWVVEDMGTHLRDVENGGLLGLRDVITMVIGRALVIGFGYQPQDLDALAPAGDDRVPEMYFLTSVLSDFRADVEAYRYQLHNTRYLSGGTAHFLYWLMKPLVQKDRR